MLVQTGNPIYFSKGTRAVHQSSREVAEAFKKELVETLVRGGMTAAEAERLASQCTASQSRHHFDMAADQKTVTVQMTREEFELVRAILGMEKTTLR